MSHELFTIFHERVKISLSFQKALKHPAINIQRAFFGDEEMFLVWI